MCRIFWQSTCHYFVKEFFGNRHVIIFEGGREKEAKIKRERANAHASEQARERDKAIFWQSTRHYFVERWGGRKRREKWKMRQGRKRRRRIGKRKRGRRRQGERER